MIIAEVGLNHNGSIKYANKYLASLKNKDIDAITFQIREDKFYLSNKRKHLKLPYSFYQKQLLNLKLKNKKKIGISLVDLKTFNNFKKINFDFYKILSFGAENRKLIDTILKSTNAKVYISCGLLKKAKMSEYLKRYKNNKRIKFIYTKLTYNVLNINLVNLFDFAIKNENKFAYGHHYTNDLPIIMSSTIKNVDIFVYVKGKKLLKHPDERHAFTFDQLNLLLKKIKEINKILGKKKYFTKTDIPGLK